jgi:anti-anti-sigma regulatory factor
MTISLKRAPSRVLSLVGATRRGRRPIGHVLSAAAVPAPARRLIPNLASSAHYSLMCWWVDDAKFAAPSDDPLLAVQLDLYERRISLRGRVDDKNVAVLADVTATLMALNPGDCIVDISAVSVIDAAGIACIANLGTELAAIGAQFRVVGAAARQRRRFGIASLNRLRDAA